MNLSGPGKKFNQQPIVTNQKDSSQVKAALTHDEYPMVNLKDGRQKCILGGLQRSVNNYLLTKNPDLSTGVKLLKEVLQEVKDLHVNPELETDEFVNLEIQKITRLFDELKNVDSLKQTTAASDIVDITSLLNSLQSKYSALNKIDQPHTVHVFFDGEESSKEKIQQNLLDRDKRDLLRTKKIIIFNTNPDITNLFKQHQLNVQT